MDPLEMISCWNCQEPLALECTHDLRGGKQGQHFGPPDKPQHGGNNFEMSCLFGWDTIKVTACQKGRANTPLQGPSI